MADSAATLNYDPDVPVYAAPDASTQYTSGNGLLASAVPEVKSRDVTSNETVSGQLSNLLSSGSPYLAAAKAGATATANGRGLMNSSIAAGAGESAAIAAAAPIAAQDASTYAASGLSAQNAGQDLTKTAFAAQTTSALKDQELYNTQAQQAQQGGIQSQLQQEKATADKAAQTQKEAATVALQTQQARDTATLQAQKDTAYSSIQTTLKAMDISIDMEKLASADRDAYTRAVGPVMQQYQSAYTSIQTQPDSVMTAAAKQTALSQLEALYKPQVAAISNIYSYDVTWPA